MDGKKRCFGGEPGKAFYAEYHDHEWGVPVYDDRHLFEMLILEGAQAGLSWETILKRRENYRKVFHHFDPAKVARMTDLELEGLCRNDGIIRNRLKIYSVRKNAQVVLSLQKNLVLFLAIFGVLLITNRLSTIGKMPLMYPQRVKRVTLLQKI